jgi:hypothetical protein
MHTSSWPFSRISTTPPYAFHRPIAGQLRAVLTRAPQRRDSAASGLPRKLRLKDRHIEEKDDRAGA